MIQRFEKYKKKIASILAFYCFFGIVCTKKKKIILYVTIVLLIIAIFYNLPNSTGMVKKKTLCIYITNEKFNDFL